MSLNTLKIIPKLPTDGLVQLGITLSIAIMSLLPTTTPIQKGPDHATSVTSVDIFTSHAILFFQMDKFATQIFWPLVNLLVWST